MNVVLLDGVGAGILFVIFGLGLLFIVAAVLLEAWIIKALKYHDNFRRALLDSTVANILSLASGFIVVRAGGDEAPDMSNMIGFLIFFVVTLIVEFIVLLLLNKSKPVSATLKVCVLMNLASYLIAFIITQLTF